MPTLLLLAYAIVQHNLPLASVTAGYILGYAALQVAKRGLNLGVKVLAASLLVGLPMNIFSCIIALSAASAGFLKDYAVNRLLTDSLAGGRARIMACSLRGRDPPRG
ncbi:MAG: hypothetical protein QXL98_04040 [Thermofilaceae archaeon]